MRRPPILPILPIALCLFSTACSRREQPQFQPLPVSNRPLEPREKPRAARRDWPPPPPPPPAPVKAAVVTKVALNGDPQGPSAEALNAVVNGALPSLQACVEAAPLAAGGELRASVTYQVTGEGVATGVAATGQVPPEALACMKRTVEALRFPPFKGAPVSGSLPVVVRRVEAVPPATAAK